MIHHFPFFFGGTHHLFGCFTRGAPNRARDCAVLLCPPLGHEYVCSYQTFRKLATRLGEAGFPVLRFDYYGTGNSAGDASAPDLVDAWHESISRAVDELRVSSGRERVAVVGLRLGATLAAAVAAERGDIDTAVLWNPCATGKSYLREARMLGLANPEQSTAPAIEAGSVEAAGFHFSTETVSTLSTIDLTRLDRKVANRVLLLSRDDLPASDRLAANLESAGAVCEEQRTAGYSKFMVSPIHSEVPESTIDQIQTWLNGAYPEMDEHHCSDHGSGVTSGPAVAVPGYAAREQPVTFGDSIAGIFTAPITDPGVSLPAVLLLNTGADHHIGPHRLYVSLAREWAERGFPVLRFDIGGIGDSPARSGQRDNEAYPANALEDVNAAICYLREIRGIECVVLAGMCSGAFHALHACTTSEVAGIIAVNPPLYWRSGLDLSTDPYLNEYEARRVWRALFAPGKWLRLATGRVDVRHSFGVFGARARGAALRVARKTRADDSQSERGKLEKLFANAPAVDIIFSEGDPAMRHLQQTFGPGFDALPQRYNLRIDVVAGAGHTFMPVAWHSSLTERLTARLVERYYPHAESVYHYSTLRANRNVPRNPAATGSAASSESIPNPPLASERWTSSGPPRDRAT